MEKMMKKILILFGLILTSSISHAYLDGFDCGKPGADGVFECIKCDGDWCEKRWCTDNFKIVSCHESAIYCIKCPI